MIQTNKWQKLLGFGTFLLAVTAVMSYLWGDLLLVEMQSDVADTLLWAEAVYNSGSLVDPAHFYPYVIPFGGQLLMVPFYHFFGFSLTTLRLGMTVFFMLLSSLLVLFFRRVVTPSLPGSLFGAGCVLMLFLNNKKLREIMYAHVIYYSLAIVFTLLLLIVLSWLWDPSADRKKKLAAYVCLCSTCFFCAGNGLVVVLFSLAPGGLAFLLERMIQVWVLKQPYRQFREDLRLCLTVLVSALVGLGAYFLISSQVDSSYAQNYFEFQGPSLWFANFRQTVIQWMFVLFQPELFSDAAAAASTGAYGKLLGKVQGGFLMGSALFLLVLTFLRYRKLESTIQRVTVLYFWVVSLLTVGLYIFTPLNTNSWRMVPMLFAMFLCYSVLLPGMFAQAGFQRVTAAVLSGFLIFCAVHAGVGTLFADRNTDCWYGEDSYINVLLQKGVTTGYSNHYDICNAVRLLSHGQIDMQCVMTFSNVAHPALYQNYIEDFRPTEEGKYFVLIMDSAYYPPMEGYTERYDGVGYFPSFRSDQDRYLEYTIYFFEHYPLEDNGVITPNGKWIDLKEYFEN